MMKHGRFTGSAALIGSAFLWATAYIFVKNLVEDIPPCMLLSLRFSLAAIILAVILFPKLKKINKKLLIAGISMGTALFFEFFFFTVGLQYTTASKSSFIIASYIIVLPVAYFIIRRRIPSKSDLLSAALCMVGICLIMADNLNGFNKGDMLSCLCAVSYAVHIVLSSQYAKKFDGGLLNLIQIATSAVLSTIAALILGDFQGGVAKGALWGIVFLAIVCTIIPYFLCLYGMKYVSTTTSGILLSFESVFATILAVLTLGEPLYWQLVLGGIIILCSSFLSELLSVWKEKRKQEQ